MKKVKCKTKNYAIVYQKRIIGPNGLFLNEMWIKFAYDDRKKYIKQYWT